MFWRHRRRQVYMRINFAHRVEACMPIVVHKTGFLHVFVERKVGMKPFLQPSKPLVRDGLHCGGERNLVQAEEVVHKLTECTRLLQHVPS